MITVDSKVKITALPESLINTPRLIGKRGVVKEVDSYFKRYTMFSVDLGKEGVFVFGQNHIQKV